MIDIDKLKQIYKFSKHLKLSDITELINASKSNTFKRKEVILNNGSSNNVIHFVRKGLIRQYMITEKGEEITFRLISENFFLANVDVVLFNQPSRFCFEAFEKTKTLSIDYDRLHEIISRNPKLLDSRVTFAQRMNKAMHRRLEMFTLHSPEERYLIYLNEFPNIVERVPDKYIANVLGITAVSLSRIKARIAKKSNT